MASFEVLTEKQAPPRPSRAPARNQTTARKTQIDAFVDWLIEEARLGDKREPSKRKTKT